MKLAKAVAPAPVARVMQNFSPRRMYTLRVPSREAV